MREGKPVFNLGFELKSAGGGRAWMWLLILCLCFGMYILDIRMKVNVARRVSEGAPGGAYYGDYAVNVPRRPARQGKICKYWVAGCCRNDHCKFSHGGLPPQNLGCLNVKNKFAPNKWCRDLSAPQKRLATVKRTLPLNVKATISLKPDTTHPAKQRITSRLIEEAASIIAQKKNVPTAITKRETIAPNIQVEVVHDKVDGKKTIPKRPGNIAPSKVEKVCEKWTRGDCADGAKCTGLHSWFRGYGYTRMALLQGHEKAISGITLPYGSDTLYSSSTDGTLRSWNCHTGQCADVINLEGEIGGLISVGPWLFVGIPNSILAKNIETSAEYVLQGVVGQVHAVIVVNDIIFAGAQDGVILVWKASSESDLLEPSATLHGHEKTVVSVSVGGNHLYTGSIDHTIKVWDMKTLQCLQTLSGHNDVVTSLLCLDHFLISCSLDQTIKIWSVNEDGKYEVNYTHKEDHGVLALAGLNDFESKPVLLCACSDNSVRLYELPSFADRGRLFTSEVVQKIHVGPSGIFFTGDRSGCTTVWRLLET